MPTIRLTWTNNSALHDSIEVQQDGIAIATLPAGTTSHDVSTAVTPGVPIEFRVRCHSDGPNRDSDWITTVYTPDAGVALYKDSLGVAVGTAAPGTAQHTAYGDLFTSLGAALLPDAPATADGPLPPFAVSFVLQLTGTMLEWGDIVLLHAPAADANDEFKVVLSREPIGFGVVFKAGVRQVMAGYTRPGLVSFDRPMHVAVTYDNATVRVYLNGALIGSAALALNMTSLQRLRVSLERLSGGGFDASIINLDPTTGNTWVRTPSGDYLSGVPLVDGARHGRHIVFHPVTRQWFAIGNLGALWTAAPGGAWSLSGHPINEELSVYSAVYDDVHDCWWLTIGTSAYKLYRVSSTFTTWTEVTTLSHPSPIGLCVQAGVVIVGGGANSPTASWLARSTDEGATWTTVFTGGPYYVEHILHDPVGGFGALDFGGLLLSPDGVTWTRAATLSGSPWSVPGLAFFANSWWVAVARGGTSTEWLRTAPGTTAVLTQVAMTNTYGWAGLLVAGDRLLGNATGVGLSREWDLNGVEYPVVSPVEMHKPQVGSAPVPALPSQVTIVPPSQRASADVVAPVGIGPVEVLPERQLGGLRSDIPYQVDLALAGIEVPGPTSVGVSARWVRFTVVEDHGNGGSGSGWVFNELEAWSGLNRTGVNKALGRAVAFINPYPGQGTNWTGAAATDGVTTQDDSVMHYAGTLATIGSSATVDLGAIQVLKSVAAYSHPTYVRPRIRVAVSTNNTDWTDVGDLNWPTGDATALKQVNIADALVTAFTVVALDAAGQPATEGLGTTSGVLTSGSLLAASAPTGTFTFFVRGDRTWRLEGYREACGFEVTAAYLATPVVPVGTVSSNLALPQFTFSAGFLSRVWSDGAAVAALSDSLIGAPASDFAGRANGVLLQMPSASPYAIEGFNKADGQAAVSASVIIRRDLRWLVMGGSRVAASSTGCRTWSVETFPAEVLAVTFDNDRAFALLATGDLYMSSDAERLSWTLLVAVPKNASEIPVGMAAGNGALVVLLHTPGSGVVFLAMDMADPLSWNRTERAENWPLAIAFGMGRFVAVGSNVAWTSVDAVTWGATALSDTLRAVACNGSFFAAPGAGTGAVYVSTDGVSWSLEYLTIWEADTRSVGVLTNGDFMVSGEAYRSRRMNLPLGDAMWGGEGVPGSGSITAIPNTLQPAPAGRWLNIRARQLVQSGPRLAWTLSTDRYTWMVAITRSNTVLLLAACSDTPPADQFTLTKVDEYDFIARVLLPAGTTTVTIKAGFITIEAQPVTAGTVTLWWDGEVEPGAPTATTQVPYPPQYGTECAVDTLMLQRTLGPWWIMPVPVGQAPVITSALAADLTWGEPFSYVIAADHFPTSFDAWHATQTLLASARVWLRAEDYAGGAWPNKGTYGDLGFTVSGVAPVLVPHEGVRFNGTGSLMGALSATPATTAFAVFRSTSAAGQSILTVKTTSNPTAQAYTPTYLINWSAAGAVATIDGYTYPSAYRAIQKAGGAVASGLGVRTLVAHAYAGSAPVWCEVNGVVGQFANLGGSDGANDSAGVAVFFNIGADYGGDNGNFYGDVSEVLIFDRVLTTDERALVNAYLKTKWSIA